jgi:hypothetical protein
MDYKAKIKFAKEVAEQLETQKSSDEIRSALKAEGLYERDIINIFVSARNILGEKYQPKIEECLKADKQIQGSDEFKLLDHEVIEILIKRGTQKLALEEKKKVTKLIKEGQSIEQVLEQVDTRFLSIDKVTEQISNLQEVKAQNSVNGRMLNIVGGLGLIVLTGVLAITMDRLFYVLPISGLIMIVKGITTKSMEYDG